MIIKTTSALDENETDPIHGIGAYICGDILRAMGGGVDRPAFTHSIPGTSAQSGSGASTQAMHDPARGVLEEA